MPCLQESKQFGKVGIQGSGVDDGRKERDEQMPDNEGPSPMGLRKEIIQWL